MGREIAYELVEFDTVEKASTHIKWCRTNLGERGRSWDFNTNGGLGRRLYLQFFTEAAHAGWVLRWG